MILRSAKLVFVLLILPVTIGKSCPVQAQSILHRLLFHVTCFLSTPLLPASLLNYPHFILPFPSVTSNKPHCNSCLLNCSSILPCFAVLGCSFSPQSLFAFLCVTLGWVQQDNTESKKGHAHCTHFCCEQQLLRSVYYIITPRSVAWALQVKSHKAYVLGAATKFTSAVPVFLTDSGESVDTSSAPN